MPLHKYSGWHAAEFRRVFQVELKDYWNGLGFDMLKFEEDFIQSRTRTVGEEVMGRFGREAVTLLRALLEVVQ